MDDDNKGPEILKSELDKSLGELSDKKATVIDETPTELLKNIGEKIKYQLFKMKNKKKKKDSYNNESLLPDFVKNRIIVLPNKSNATELGNYRTIPLLYHVSKILLNIIENRLRKNIEQNISVDQ